jgi:hypothetical protein
VGGPTNRFSARLPGEPSHHSFPKGKKIIPMGKEGSRIKNPRGDSKGERYRYRKIIRAYSIHISHAKNFPAESLVKIPVPKNFPRGDWVKNFPLTGLGKNFRL